MKLKALKCPNCDAKIEIKPGETHGTCTYCDSEFILEDEVVRVKHEIVDNTSLDVAETTLNKFKNYQKAEYLYRTMLYKYAHKEDVYIGLIRSITHDFNLEINQLYTINEINDYWQKYTSLTTKTNIAKYSPSINEINRKFWLNKLTSETNNFTLLKLGVNTQEVENAWNKYTLFSEEKEYVKLESKYKDYLVKLKKYQTTKKKKIKATFTTICVLIVVIIVSLAIYAFTEKPIKKFDELKTSTLYKYCGPEFNCTDKAFIENFFYPTIADLTITKTEFNKEKNTLTVETELKSSIKDLKKEYTFDVVDDSGPYIEETNCKFTDTEDIDLTKCFKITDYTDGTIDVSKAKIDKNKENFKKQGEKTIKVTATDKDKNKETKEVKVTIIPTPITLNVDIPTSVEINKTATLSYEVTPDVSNKDVTITYDKKIITIKDNVITPVKLGESEVCLTSKYDTNTKVCKTIDVTPICQDSYTFTFDGSKEEKITAGVDFCAGTYKVYAEVLNHSDVYYIHHYQADLFAGSSTITIAKFSSFLNDEGDKWSMAKRSYIKTAPGVMSITITK